MQDDSLCANTAFENGFDDGEEQGDAPVTSVLSKLDTFHISTSTPIGSAGDETSVGASGLATAALDLTTADFSTDSTDFGDGFEPAGATSAGSATATCDSTGAGISTSSINEADGVDGAVDDECGNHRPAFCIFVASLSAQRTDDALWYSVRELFQTFGTILNVKVLRDPKNRPYAFVQYGNAADAERALTQGHRSLIHGREVRCERARVNRTVLVCSKDPGESVLYHTATELGTRYGPVEDVVNLLSHGGGGSGKFIQFEYREDAARAYVGLQAEPNFSVFWVQNVGDASQQHPQHPATSPREFNHSDARQLYVGPLPRSTTEEQVREKFGKFGNVVGVEFVPRKSYRGNGVAAFVQFESFLSAVQAIERTDHTLWLGRTVHVRCREVRQAMPRFAPLPTYARGMVDAQRLPEGLVSPMGHGRPAQGTKYSEAPMARAPMIRGPMVRAPMAMAPMAPMAPMAVSRRGQAYIPVQMAKHTNRRGKENNKASMEMYLDPASTNPVYFAPQWQMHR